MKLTPEVKHLIKRELRRSIEAKVEEVQEKIAKATMKAWPTHAKTHNAFFRSKEYKAFEKAYEAAKDASKKAGAEQTFVNHHRACCGNTEVESSITIHQAKNWGPSWHVSEDRNGVNVHYYGHRNLPGTPAFDSVREMCDAAETEIQGMADSYVSALADASMGADFTELKNIVKKYGINL